MRITTSAFVGTDFSIGKRAVTVTATAGQGKTYGNADPSSYGYTYSDLGTRRGACRRARPRRRRDVGTYAIGQGSLTNASNSNYDISFVGADFSIGKRAVTVTANCRPGQDLWQRRSVVLATAISDLGSGVALVGALDRASGENVGTYAIGQGTITNAANSNYDITLSPPISASASER